MKKITLSITVLLFSSFVLSSCLTAKAENNETTLNDLWEEIMGIKPKLETLQSDVTQVKNDVTKISEKSEELVRERATWKTYYDTYQGKLVRSQTEAANLIPLEELKSSEQYQASSDYDVLFGKTIQALDQTMAGQVYANVDSYKLRNPVVVQYFRNENLLPKSFAPLPSKKNLQKTKKLTKKACPCDTLKSATAVADSTKK